MKFNKIWSTYSWVYPGVLQNWNRDWNLDHAIVVAAVS